MPMIVARFTARWSITRWIADWVRLGRWIGVGDGAWNPVTGCGGGAPGAGGRVGGGPGGGAVLEAPAGRAAAPAAAEWPEAERQRRPQRRAPPARVRSRPARL